MSGHDRQGVSYRAPNSVLGVAGQAMQRDLPLTAFHRCGETKVAQLGDAAIVNEDVGRLDIAVGQLCGAVKVRQTCCHLPGDHEPLIRAEADLSGVVLQQFIQGSFRSMVVDQAVPHIVGEAEKLDNVRVVQRSEHGDLVGELGLLGQGQVQGRGQAWLCGASGVIPVACPMPSPCFITYGSHEG